MDLADSAEAAEALYKLLHNMWVFTRHHTLHNWAMMRWFEALIPSSGCISASRKIGC